MLYPNMDGLGWIGVFLEVPNISLPLTIGFSLDLHLQIYPQKFTKERQFNSRNTFDYYHQNYGWKKALSTVDYKAALSKQLIIECHVRPELPNSEGSKEKFGYVGMVNEGTTCYLNSLLQTLYHITAFRKAVYLLPTAEDETSTIPVCLQRVFYCLQEKTQAVSTRELLSSFGWGLEELNTQHDVQEFNCVLSDTLDRKMKGTEVEGTCARLFEGVMTNFIECLNVDYKSTREEKFIDLQLNVKGCSSLMESFSKYLEVEELKGDDLYDAEGYGKQEAKKGISFRRLPPVLQLQLKRFEYDPETDAMGKVHDRFTFPVSLDLSAFLPGDANSHQYELLSVLIHAGTTAAGHYFAFLRPQLTDWYKFNDEAVERVSWEYVTVCGFGGELKGFSVEENTGVEPKTTRNDMSAYMLVYIQRDLVSDILFRINREDIPARLEMKFRNEESERDKTRAADLKRRQSCNVMTVTLEMVKGWDKAGLTPCDTPIYAKIPMSGSRERRYLWNFPKTISLSVVKRRVEKRLQGAQCRLWLFTPGYLNWGFMPLNYTQTVGQAFDTKSDSPPKALYIEVPDTVRLFHKSPRADGEIWDFAAAAEGNSELEMWSSDSTAVLEAEINGLCAPLTVSNSVPVFYKWYQWKEGKSIMSVIASMNLSGEITAEALRDDIYFHYMEEARSSDKKVTLYIEKSNKQVHSLRPGVICIAAEDNPMLSSMKKEDAIYLEAGDVVIGESDLSPWPEDYRSPKDYLEEILDLGTIRLRYHDKYEYYPFKSYSRELFDSVDQEWTLQMSLKSSQKQVMERIATLFESFLGSITWEHVQLYEYNVFTKHYEELDFPDVTGYKLHSPELMSFLSSQGNLYFDITKFPIPKMKTGCLVHVSAR